MPRAAAGRTAGADRRATATHAVTIGLAFLFLLHANRKQWFYWDEWDFLAHRGLGGPDASIWAPHNEHWTSIPAVVYLAIRETVGIEQPLLFAVPVLVAHCVVVHLLWRLCVRAGVRPWIATATTATFAFLGAGSANLLWGFQVTFVGSVAFGLAALLAVESPTAPRRNLPLGWLASVASLACSGIGLTFLLITLIVALMRRGWRWAIRFGSVPVLAQMAWQLRFGGGGASEQHRVSGYSVPWVPEFVLNGAEFALARWTGLDGLGGLLVVVVIALALGQVARGGAHLTTGVLALGLVPFYLMLAYGRVRQGPDEAMAERYAYVAVALVLPAVGVAIDQVVRQPVHWAALALGASFAASAGAGAVVNNARAQQNLERTDRITIQSAQRLLDLGQPILLRNLESHGFDFTAGRLRELNERGLRIGTSELTQGEFLEGRMRLQVEVGETAPPTPEMRLDNLAGVGDGMFTLTEATEQGPGCVAIAGEAGVTFTGWSTAASSFGLRLRAPGTFTIALLERGGESPTIPYVLGAGEWRRVATVGDGLQIRVTLPGGTAVVCSRNAAWSVATAGGRPAN